MLDQKGEERRGARLLRRGPVGTHYSDGEGALAHSTVKERPGRDSLFRW